MAVRRPFLIHVHSLGNGIDVTIVRLVPGIMKFSVEPSRFRGVCSLTDTPRLENTMGEMIEFAANGHQAQGYLAVPEAGSGAGVMVIQEWWGLAPQIKRTCDRLAEAGFVALAPDLYHGELAEHHEMDKAGELMNKLVAEMDHAATDMSGAVTALLDHDAVTSSSVGVVGFCMGGMLTLVIAAKEGQRVGAAAPFYGAPLGDGGPDFSNMSAKVCLLYTSPSPRDRG